MMDEREAAAWAAMAASAASTPEGPWPEGVSKLENEIVRDADTELATASTRPIHRLTGRRRVFFSDGTSTPWRTAEERGVPTPA